MNFFLLRAFVAKVKSTLRSNDTWVSTLRGKPNVGNRVTGKTGGTDKRVTPLVSTLRGKQAGKRIVE